MSRRREDGHEPCVILGVLALYGLAYALGVDPPEPRVDHEPDRRFRGSTGAARPPRRVAQRAIESGRRCWICGQSAADGHTHE